MINSSVKFCFLGVFGVHGLLSRHLPFNIRHILYVCSTSYHDVNLHYNTSCVLYICSGALTVL